MNNGYIDFSETLKDGQICWKNRSGSAHAHYFLCFCFVSCLLWLWSTREKRNLTSIYVLPDTAPPDTQTFKLITTVILRHLFYVIANFFQLSLTGFLFHHLLGLHFVGIPLRVLYPKLGKKNSSCGQTTTQHSISFLNSNVTRLAPINLVVNLHSWVVFTWIAVKLRFLDPAFV